MAFESSIGILKRHPVAIGGGLVGFFLLVYLYERSKSGSAPASATDLSGGGNQVQALSAAADLTNAQTNAQVEVAAYQAGVQTNGIAAQLQESLATTAAELEASKAQTASATAVALGAQAAGVTTAEISAEADIAKAQLESKTVLGLSSNAVQMEKVAASIPLAQIKEQENIYSTLAANKKLGGDSTGVAQIVSAVYGRGPEAIAADQPSKTASAAGSTPGAIIGSIGSVVKGLFA